MFPKAKGKGGIEMPHLRARRKGRMINPGGGKSLDGRRKLLNFKDRRGSNCRRTGMKRQSPEGASNQKADDGETVRATPRQQ